MQALSTVDLQIQVNIQPVKVVSYSPRALAIKLEALASKSIPLNLVIRGEPAIGYQAEDPILSTDQIVVTGPISQVERVAKIQATLDINQASEDILLIINVTALDQNDMVVEDVTLITGSS